jgi:Co/Zn/Cd efflux system component
MVSSKHSFAVPQVMAKKGKVRLCGLRMDIMAAVFTLLITWAFTGSIIVRAMYRLTHGIYHVNGDIMLAVAVSRLLRSIRFRSHASSHASSHGAVARSDWHGAASPFGRTGRLGVHR